MLTYRHFRLASLLAVVVLALAACGGDDEDPLDSRPETTAPTEGDGGETIPPEEVPPEDDEDGTEALTTIILKAEDISFSDDTLQVPPGEMITVEFTNLDSVPHNFAAYRSDDASEEIFVGETITGPDTTVTYEFSSPAEAGTYFFRCDVHPQEMTGQLIVF